jgi:hypothetical protein
MQAGRMAACPHAQLLESTAMDKDLRDAVLAAFDDESDDSDSGKDSSGEKAEPDADASEEGAEDKKAGSAEKGEKEGGGRPSQKAMMAKAAMSSRMKSGGTRRGSKPQAGVTEEDGESSSGRAARVAAPVVRSKRSKGAGDTSAGGSGSSKLLFLSLGLNLLTILLLILVMNHLSSQVDELRGTLEQRLDGIQEGVLDTREMAKFARIKFGTYVEPGKRPQSVIVVVEEKAGRLMMGKTVVRPLEEEE